METIQITEKEIDFGVQEWDKLGHNPKFKREYVREIIYIAKTKGIPLEQIDFNSLEEIKSK